MYKKTAISLILGFFLLLVFNVSIIKAESLPWSSSQTSHRQNSGYLDWSGGQSGDDLFDFLDGSTVRISWDSPYAYSSYPMIAFRIVNGANGTCLNANGFWSGDDCANFTSMNFVNKSGSGYFDFVVPTGMNWSNFGVYALCQGSGVDCYLNSVTVEVLSQATPTPTPTPVPTPTPTPSPVPTPVYSPVPTSGGGFTGGSNYIGQTEDSNYNISSYLSQNFYLSSNSDVNLSKISVVVGSSVTNQSLYVRMRHCTDSSCNSINGAETYSTHLNNSDSDTFYPLSQIDRKLYNLSTIWFHRVNWLGQTQDDYVDYPTEMVSPVAGWYNLYIGVNNGSVKFYGTTSSDSNSNLSPQLSGNITYPAIVIGQSPGNSIFPNSGGSGDSIFEGSSCDVSSYFTDVEPVSTDILGHLWWIIRKWFWNTFSPNCLFDTSQFAPVQSVLLGKAPFAYAVSFFSGFDTSSITTISEPSIILHLLNTDYVWNPPSFLSGMFSTFQGIIILFIWLGFAVYLFHLPSRIITK